MAYAQMGRAGPQGQGRTQQKRQPQQNYYDNNLGLPDDVQNPAHRQPSPIAAGTAGPVRTVRLEGQVLLKVIRHCRLSGPNLVTSGSLVGMYTPGHDDAGNPVTTAEVTNCFPRLKDAKGQTDLLQKLRLVKMDSSMVGWYRAATHGTWISAEQIKEHYKLQTAQVNSIVLVYDPNATTHGKLAMKAFRLTDSFMELYKHGQLGAIIGGEGVRCDNIFEELQLQVHNSHLVHGFLYELRANKSMSCDYDRLNMVSSSKLVDHIRELDFSAEQCIHEGQQLSYKKRRFQYMKKSAMEQIEAKGQVTQVDPDTNSSVVLRSSEELDAWITKKQKHVSQLELVLETAKTRHHCNALSEHLAESFSKHYIAHVIQMRTTSKSTKSSFS